MATAVPITRGRAGGLGHWVVAAGAPEIAPPGRRLSRTVGSMRPTRRSPLFVAALALTLLAVARAGGPVEFRTLTQAAPQQRAYVARIDLTDPRVAVEIVPAGPDPDGDGPWETTLQLPSVVARDRKFDLAVNGGFFEHLPANAGFGDWGKYSAGDPARAAGLVVAGGQAVSHRRNGAVLAVVAGPAGGKAATRAVVTTADAVPPDATLAVGGSWQLVDAGRNVAPDDNAARHARTAAGVTDDGRTLVLLVADGNRPGWAAGLTLKELPTS